MNLKLRRVVGVGVSILLLGICQISVPLTLTCIGSVVGTVALCIAAIVILSRKGLLEKKTENPLLAPAWLPIYIAVLGNMLYNESLFDHTRKLPFLQDAALRGTIFIQWYCLFFCLPSPRN